MSTRAHPSWRRRAGDSTSTQKTDYLPTGSRSVDLARGSCWRRRFARLSQKEWRGRKRWGRERAGLPGRKGRARKAQGRRWLEDALGHARTATHDRALGPLGASCRRLLFFLVRFECTSSDMPSGEPDSDRPCHGCAYTFSQLEALIHTGRKLQIFVSTLPVGTRRLSHRRRRHFDLPALQNFVCCRWRPRASINGRHDPRRDAAGSFRELVVFPPKSKQPILT